MSEYAGAERRRLPLWVNNGRRRRLARCPLHPDNGLRADIAPCPVGANNSLMHRSKKLIVPPLA
jgi:hypothetical protein